MANQPIRYPITTALESIVDHFFDCRQVLIVSGDTGIGKSSQIPRALLDACLSQCLLEKRMIVCTQPLGLAARTLANRVAIEIIEPSRKNQVGYATEFDDNFSDGTVLKYVTDFTLVQEVSCDRLFSRYNVVIIDECEQATIWTDALLLLLKKALITRDDLKVIILTSHYDTSKFESYFNVTALRYNSQHQSDSEVSYEENTISDYHEACSNKLEEILTECNGSGGNIVVFLPCDEDVDIMFEEFGAKIVTIHNTFLDRSEYMRPVELLRLHSSLSTNPDLYKALPRNGRKVILATSIAESSFSNQDVRYVIDSGYTEVQFYDQVLHLEYTMKTRISEAAATQRASLGGSLLRPLKCHRTYDISKALERKAPAFCRRKLDYVILLMKRGTHDFNEADLINKPDSRNFETSLNHLKLLGALDDSGNVTSLGHTMLRVPVEPEMAKMILAGHEFGCLDEVVTLAAMLLAPDCFQYPKKKLKGADEGRRSFRHNGGDHLTLVNVYNTYISEGKDSEWCKRKYINQAALEHAVSVREKLYAVASVTTPPGFCPNAETTDNEIKIKKAILAGYFTQVAKLQSSGHYTTQRGNKIVHLHPLSSLERKPLYVIYTDFVHTTTRNFIRQLSDIDPAWLTRYEAGPSNN